MPTNSVILITGSSTGFGRLMAGDFARKGYTVFASMRDVAGHNANASQELRDLATQEKLALHVVELDVTDEMSVDRAVSEAIHLAGHLDVLINNTGIAYIGPNETFALEQVQQQFDTNVFGVARMFSFPN